MTRRVVAYSSLWTAIAVFMLGWILLGIYRTSLNTGLAELQQAQLFSLIAAVDVDDNGVLVGIPDLGDANFEAVGSGWYWRVADLNNPANAMASASLTDGLIDRLAVSQAPFDDLFQRSYQVAGPDGNQLRVLETELNMSDTVSAVFQVTANANSIRAALGQYTRQIGSLLSLFALGLVITNALVILFGLRPLEQLRDSLFAIREGHAKHLEGRFPAEIQPVADELNIMIDNNRRILERSRMQVGNLAHSLKTPLAVLMNAARSENEVEPGLIETQSQSMKAQIDHYLDRARVAAQRDSVVYRTNVVETLAPLVRVIQKLNPTKNVTFEAPEDPVVFAGEKEDLEEIVGNLLENAAKWARHTLSLRVETDGADIILTVCDDGPGIPSENRGAALKRGERLDETVPGTGLGLAIVQDAVRSYGGQLVLGEASLGGLEVKVIIDGLRS